MRARTRPAVTGARRREVPARRRTPIPWAADTTCGQRRVGGKQYWASPPWGHRRRPREGAASGFFQRFTELAQHPAVMAVGELVSDRQDQRHRPFDDLHGGQYSNAGQKGELLGRGQFNTSAEHVETHCVAGNSALSRPTCRLRVRARGTEPGGVGVLWGDSRCGHGCHPFHRRPRTHRRCVLAFYLVAHDIQGARTAHGQPVAASGHCRRRASDDRRNTRRSRSCRSARVPAMASMGSPRCRLLHIPVGHGKAGEFRGEQGLATAAAGDDTVVDTHGPRRWTGTLGRDSSAAAQYRAGQDVAVVLVQRCGWLRAGSAASLSCRSGKSWRRAGVRGWIGLRAGGSRAGPGSCWCRRSRSDDAGPLGHGLVAVVDRQPDLVAGAVQVREGKILH